MKNIFTSILVFLAGVSIVNAQTEGFSCTAGEMTQKEYDKHPQLLIAKEQLDTYTREFVQHRQSQAQQRSQRSTSTYVIPVVFHIQHFGGNENLSDSMIYVEMEHWNEYMGMRNAELATTDSAFVGLIGNPDVQFRLAQIDPDGHCTNGIERIYTQATYFGDNNSKLNPWPPEKYLNVWLVKGIDKDTTQYNTLAYSMYPSSVATYVNNDIIDGIIAKSFVVGGNQQFSRPTLAHECGHWMNLEHTWGNTNAPGVACGDDEVNDTPITKGNQNNCIHNLVVCNPPIIENEQNIMNYANCHFLFTKGQVDRMTAALNSSVAGRSNIWSDANKIATGVMDSIAYPNPNSCAIPVADFAVNRRVVCLGEALGFTDVSWNAAVTSRRWTFTADADSTGYTLSDARPIITFTTPGWKQVTLTVSNANGSSQKVKTMVYIYDPAVSPITTPAFEGFEDPTSAQNNWQVVNYDNNNTSFQYFPYVGHQSGSSYRLNMYDASYNGDNDELYSPMYDLTPLDESKTDPAYNMTLSFDYSFATYDVAHMSDSVATLSVYASNDCGSTWRRIYFNTGGFNLYNAGTIATGVYVPGTDDEYWQTVTIDIPATIYTAQSPVNFRFSVGSAVNANQFYIDNINLGKSPLGINNVKANTIGSMNIVPNPSAGAATLVLNTISPSANTSAKMYDVMGREVMTIFSGQLESGQKNVAFDTENISEGVYTVKVSDGKTSIQKRFVKM